MIKSNLSLRVSLIKKCGSEEVTLVRERNLVFSRIYALSIVQLSRLSASSLIYLLCAPVYTICKFGTTDKYANCLI